MTFRAFRLGKPHRTRTASGVSCRDSEPCGKVPSDPLGTIALGRRFFRNHQAHRARVGFSNPMPQHTETPIVRTDSDFHRNAMVPDFVDRSLTRPSHTRFASHRTSEVPSRNLRVEWGASSSVPPTHLTAPLRPPVQSVDFTTTATDHPSTCTRATVRFPTARRHSAGGGPVSEETTPSPSQTKAAEATLIGGRRA